MAKKTNHLQASPALLAIGLAVVMFGLLLIALLQLNNPQIYQPKAFFGGRFGFFPDQAQSTKPSTTSSTNRMMITGSPFQGQRITPAPGCSGSNGTCSPGCVWNGSRCIFAIAVGGCLGAPHPGCIGNQTPTTCPSTWVTIHNGAATGCYFAKYGVPTVALPANTAPGGKAWFWDAFLQQWTYFLIGVGA